MDTHHTSTTSHMLSALATQVPEQRVWDTDMMKQTDNSGDGPLVRFGKERSRWDWAWAWDAVGYPPRRAQLWRSVEDDIGGTNLQSLRPHPESLTASSEAVVGNGRKRSRSSGSPGTQGMQTWLFRGSIAGDLLTMMHLIAPLFCQSKHLFPACIWLKHQGSIDRSFGHAQRANYCS